MTISRFVWLALFLIQSSLCQIEALSTPFARSIVKTQKSKAHSSRKHCIARTPPARQQNGLILQMSTSEDDNEGVVELVEEEEKVEVAPAAPFLSQGELAEGVLNPDLSDPKQTRVIIYIILSLIPVLFLVPLMLGSRDLIPLDALPPVEL